MIWWRSMIWTISSSRLLHGIRGHDVSRPHGVSSSFEFPTYLSASAPPLYGAKSLTTEVDTPMLPLKALAVLALALVAITPSFALEDNQCYSSCKGRCVARYACEGRHPGPNCFTNFNKCRISCWRMCRHLTGFFAQSGLRPCETEAQRLLEAAP